mgnify:CR=1 FL=1
MCVCVCVCVCVPLEIAFVFKDARTWKQIRNMILGFDDEPESADSAYERVALAVSLHKISPALIEEQQSAMQFHELLQRCDDSITRDDARVVWKKITESKMIESIDQTV